MAVDLDEISRTKMTNLATLMEQQRKYSLAGQQSAGRRSWQPIVGRNERPFAIGQSAAIFKNDHLFFEKKVL